MGLQVFKKKNGVLYWIDLAQINDKLGKELLAFQEKLIPEFN
jgi:hypothetical protein